MFGSEYTDDELREEKDPSPYDGDMPDEDGSSEAEDDEDFPDLDEDEVEDLDFDDDEERFDRAAGDAGPDE